MGRERLAGDRHRSDVSDGASEPAEPLPTGLTVEDPLSPTIFHEPWFLRAATAGSYQEVTIERHGMVIARFPFVLRRQAFGRTTCGMPQLAHFLGPAVEAGSGAPVNRAIQRDKLIRLLLDKMPPTSGFNHKLHGGITDVMVFQERGYRTSVQFTYEIAPADEQTLWLSMRDKTRNAIRQADKRFQVTSEITPIEFCAFYESSLDRSGTPLSYDKAILVSVCTELLARGRGQLLAARQTDGRTVAAILTVWDRRAAYYLLSTRSMDAGNGAVSLLVWQAIKEAASLGLVFDFDGVATLGSRLFFNGFGGTVVPRYIVSRYTVPHRLTDKVLSLVTPAKPTKYF